MSEHEHEYELDVQGGFYYCECGESDIDIVALMKEYILVNSRAEMSRRETVKLKKRIKALEEVVEAVKWLVEKYHGGFDADGNYVECVCKVCEELAKLEEV